MNSNTTQIVVMTAGGANPQIVINALFREFPGLTVIEEQPETKGLILRRRARKLGWITALGQIATMAAAKFTKRLSQRRAQEIIATYGVSTTENPAIPVTHVTSLNSPSAHAAVATLKPSVVITVSCRILSRQTLAAIPCPVINLHAGINPNYRGQTGGYWALVEDDVENFGATMHLVDAGIDTGGTLYETRVTPSKDDSLATYPLLLTAASIEMILRATKDALSGTLSPYDPPGPSTLRYNPTIWTWLRYGLTKAIW